MTTYQQLQKERSYASLQKIINAAQSPVSFSDMAEATGFNPSHVRTLVSRNPQHFKDFGTLAMHGRRKMNYYQALSSDELLATAEKQAIYYKPYDQLMRAPQYINVQAGRQFSG